MDEPHAWPDAPYPSQHGSSAAQLSQRDASPADNKQDVFSSNLL